MIYYLPLKDGHLAVSLTDLIQLALISAFALIFLALWLGDKLGRWARRIRKRISRHKEGPR